jgi:hypothetical protein
MFQTHVFHVPNVTNVMFMVIPSHINGPPNPPTFSMMKVSFLATMVESSNLSCNLDLSNPKAHESSLNFTKFKPFNTKPKPFVKLKPLVLFTKCFEYLSD